MGRRGRAPWALTGKVLWGDPQEGVGEPPAQTQGPQGSCARHLPQHGGVCVAGRLCCCGTQFPALGGGGGLGVIWDGAGRGGRIASRCARMGGNAFAAPGVVQEKGRPW